MFKARAMQLVAMAATITAVAAMVMLLMVDLKIKPPGSNPFKFPSRAPPPPKPPGPVSGQSPGLYAYGFKPVLGGAVSPSPQPERYAEDMRRCTCRDNWKELVGTAESICTCRQPCPNKVTPKFLTDALGQDNCSLRRRTGFNCWAECRDDGKIYWFAEGCGGSEPGAKPCPALVVTPTGTPTQTHSPKPTIVVPQVTWDPNEVYDLRGAGCEMKDGKEQCYMIDAQGRENCPASITSQSLAFPGSEYSMCQPAHAKDYYCTIACQDGNEVVRWGVHEVRYCFSSENFGNCPPRPSVIPKSEFKLIEWSEPQRPLTRCQAANLAGDRVPVIEDLSVGLLTHEHRSFGDTMKTYDKWGLFDVIPEFIIYANNRGPAIDIVANEYIAKYPGKIRILGDSGNHGIARGIVFLTNNASKPYFLFLERDFQLIEPKTCVYEQLKAGVDLVKAGGADVVRRPNWAVRMFRGNEDDVWNGRQPNLGCNHFYWIPDPEVRWPDKFWVCGDNPQMLCSDSFYCNWTNNPQLWSIAWWNREYVANFDSFLRNDPWYDLEMYMNWEPNSWNDRGFTVAQGEGLFKHMDRGNIVHV